MGPQTGLRFAMHGRVPVCQRVGRGGDSRGCHHFVKYSPPVTMETSSPRLKFQCSQCCSLTGLMGDEKLMVDLHVISVRLRGCSLPPPAPLPFYGGLYESLDASDRRRGAAAPSRILVLLHWGCRCTGGAALCRRGTTAPEVLAGEPLTPLSRDGGVGCCGGVEAHGGCGDGHPGARGTPQRSCSRCFQGESARGCQPGGCLCLLLTAARFAFY